MKPSVGWLAGLFFVTAFAPHARSADCDLPGVVGGAEPLTGESTSHSSPGIVWSGSDYGLAWTDSRHGNAEVYFARRDASGQPIGSDLRLTEAAGIAFHVDVAWDGTHYAVLYAEGSFEDWQPTFVRIDTSGAVVGSPIALGDPVDDVIGGDLSWNGTDWAWVRAGYSDATQNNIELYFTRLDTTGNPYGGDVRLTDATGNSYQATVAWTGSEYGVAWEDFRSGSVEIWFMRLDASGGLIGSQTLLSSGGSGSVDPSLVWTGTEYGLTYALYTPPLETDVQVLRLDATGTPLASAVPITALGGEQEEPRLAWSGSGYGLMWTDERNGDKQIWFTTLGANGIPATPELRVSFDTDDHYRPELAWSGSEFALVWQRSLQLSLNQNFFARVSCECPDGDLDGTTVCSDCDDTDEHVYPGATEICDGVNNDCLHPDWPVISTVEPDEDLDGVSTCGGDCNDADGTTWPGAPQLCDGINNDCDDPSWPTLPLDERDDDADGVRTCAGDNCEAFPNPGQEDLDTDGRGDLCDNCPVLFNPTQGDVDLDGPGDLCDNCPLAANPEQADFDTDTVGDRCDLDDGRLSIYLDDPDWVSWDTESGHEAWNVYRGALETLFTTGVYTPLPGVDPLTLQSCGLPSPLLHDPELPAAGEIAFYLTTGIVGGVEGGLGTDGSGSTRPNDHPCP